MCWCNVNWLSYALNDHHLFQRVLCVSLLKGYPSACNDTGLTWKHGHLHTSRDSLESSWMATVRYFTSIVNYPLIDELKMLKTWDPSTNTDLTFIPVWMNNHMPSLVWDEITEPFLNLNGCIVEVWEWIGNLIPHFIIGCNPLSMLILKLIHVSKGG